MNDILHPTTSTDHIFIQPDSEYYAGDISELIQDYEEPVLVGEDFFAEDESVFDVPRYDVPRNIFFLSLAQCTPSLIAAPFLESTPSDSTRSGGTLSDPSTSSLGKRKAAPTSPPSDSVVERPLKRANISADEHTTRTELPQDPGAPYIIVRHKAKTLPFFDLFLEFQGTLPTGTTALGKQANIPRHSL